jgi:hypothetical protein
MVAIAIVIAAYIVTRQEVPIPLWVTLAMLSFVDIVRGGS